MTYAPTTSATSGVDSIVLSPDVRLLGHVNVHDVTMRGASYITFLEDALIAFEFPEDD